MTPRRPLLLTALALAAAAVTSAPGQEAGAPGARPRGPEPDTVPISDPGGPDDEASGPRREAGSAEAGPAEAPRGDGPPARDPFATPEPMLRAAGGAGPAGVRGEAGAPTLRVKGLLKLAGRAPGALLAVGEATHVVRTGDTLRVLWGGREVALRVVEVGARDLTLELGEGGPRVRVR